MSDRIYELIENVKGKATSFHQELVKQRSVNENLTNELSKIKEQLALKEKELSDLKIKCRELESGLVTNDEKFVGATNGSKVSNEQIDELVKEIDYCIAQLKK